MKLCLLLISDKLLLGNYARLPDNQIIRIKINIHFYDLIYLHSLKAKPRQSQKHFTTNTLKYTSN